MPSEAADVSVIIPAYRAAGTIARALESVARQTLRPREVIVVDDGSDDGTTAAAEACRALLGDIRLTVLHQKHAGAGAARNRGIEASTSTYVAFLDADDEWMPEKLARTMPHMAGTANVLVSHNPIVDDGDRETVVDCARHFQATAGDRFASMYRRGYVSTSTVIARRAAIIDAGGFDTGLANAQDFNLWLALLEPPGTPFHVFGEALSRYHVTPGSIMTHTERRLGCCLDIARRYYPALRRRPGWPLASLWFRIAAVHYEAFAAYRACGRWGAALWTLARLPLQMAANTARVLTRVLTGDSTPPLRAAHPQNTPAKAVQHAPVYAFAISAWLVVVLGAYLYQFGQYVQPILRALGFA